MEHGFLKAPWEVLVRNFRAGHKPLAKEVEIFSTTLAQLIHHSSRFPNGGQGNLGVCQENIALLEEKLTALKKQLENVRARDEQSMHRCHLRIKHLQTKSTPNLPSSQLNSAGMGNEKAVDEMDVEPPVRTAIPEESNDNHLIENGEDGDGSENECVMEGVEMTSVPSKALENDSRWEKLRLDRALVDYMLREGMYETAESLAASQTIEEIVDMDIFRESRVVIEALRRRDCSEGLRWCNENKRRLQKVQSRLEFRLRLQEFVEHARAGRKTDAIAYMKKFLSVSNCDSERLLDIQRFMALLAFAPNTSCQPYKDMYSERKWLELEIAFKQDNYRLHGLTRESTIEIMLKAGLASLKTRKCGTEADRKPNCPTCVEPHLSLAQSLPRGRHENSILVCSISGEIMDENNPPMAMPNGHVYSQKALTKLAEDNDGTVVDPRNQDTARLDELRKCFIM